ncbi:hypothetical protein [Kribbella sp. NPDC051718]|uniref:hypothetical protein n=1 Tax=Kribbella sp. NPDC051718 TaxID=3155168 RepID=UPI0034381A65
MSKLQAAIRAKGVTPRVLVASAGLGLCSLDFESPSYSATFAPGHPDSVGANRLQSRAWWDQLRQAAATSELEQPFGGPTLLVLSETYASAMTNDLALLERRNDVVVFGGSDGLLERQRFPSDLGLRSVLGGTAVSLNLRMAIAWVERQDEIEVEANRNREDWETWAVEVRATTTYGRQPLDDAAVIDWIRDARKRQPSLSKTAALRLLRDSGAACEQRRFGELFRRLTEDV